uniref:uncharacterized protein LOC120340553 n=1 Tax=Styela clava TaxID=7725 RepID=UPI001939D6F9|nr:uncharacterized protein LOC120340553 [Styela clava]
MACCCKRKGDVRKCVPFYIIGGILCIIGLPLMIVGIVADFAGADSVGYIGGVVIFFGLGFFLLWHMFTIENIDKNLDLDYDPNVKDIRDVVEKSRIRESTSLSAISFQQKKTGVSNLAFEGDKSADSAVVLTADDESLHSPSSAISKNGEVNTTDNNSVKRAPPPFYEYDNEALEVGEKDDDGSGASFLSISKIDIGSTSSSARSSYNGTTTTTMHENIEMISDGTKQKSLPVEIV